MENEVSEQENFENTLSITVSNEITNQILLSPNHQPNHNLINTHVLAVDMFNKEQLNEIFNLAQTFRIYIAKQRSLDHILRVS